MIRSDESCGGNAEHYNTIYNQLVIYKQSTVVSLQGKKLEPFLILVYVSRSFRLAKQHLLTRRASI